MSEGFPDGGSCSGDEIQNRFEAPHPGGCESLLRESQDKARWENEVEARSPWRRLETSVTRLSERAGIDPDQVLKLVQDRLAGEIAETVVQEFRRENQLARSPTLEQETRVSDPSGHGPDTDPRVSSPFFDVDEAARYLKKTRKAIYGLLERGRLKKLSGSHVCYFTRDMLDDFLRGETTHGRDLRARRRKKS